jgi:hypothetical protein
VNAICEQAKKDLLLTMRIQVEKLLFHDSTFSIIDLPQEINCEKVLDVVIAIEDISGVPCKRTKRGIVVYFTNC